MYFVTTLFQAEWVENGTCYVVIIELQTFLIFKKYWCVIKHALTNDLYLTVHHVEVHD